MARPTRWLGVVSFQIEILTNDPRPTGVTSGNLCTINVESRY